jgi:hypothetical protein
VAHLTDNVGFPPIPLKAGMRIRLRAISPTTGAAITGVTATEWAIYGRDESEGVIEDVVPDYSLDSDQDEALGLPHA